VQEHKKGKDLNKPRLYIEAEPLKKKEEQELWGELD